MKLNIAKLTRKEFESRAKWKCPLPGHSKHNGLEHPRCYDKCKKGDLLEEKIGFFDIEASDLKADYGIMFSYVIEDFKGRKRYEDVVKESDFVNYASRKNGMAKEDTRLIENFVKDISNFDRLIGHYSCRFDNAFARTRAVICGVDFPEWGTIFQTDTWVILKKKFALSRNSLMNATDKLTGKTNKTHLSLALKHGLIRGEKWAQDYCLDHNRKDVQDTRRLYLPISPYMRLTKSSI